MLKYLQKFIKLFYAVHICVIVRLIASLLLDLIGGFSCILIFIIITVSFIILLIKKGRKLSELLIPPRIIEED